MPIAHIPLFDEFLAGTELTRDPGSRPFVPFFDTPADVATGRFLPKLYLAYPESELSLDSLLRAIERELRVQQCAHSYEVSLAVLAIAVETSSRDTNPLDHLNSHLACHRPAQLHQTFIAPVRVPNDYSVPTGTVVLRAFDPSRLLYWANRGRSRYPIDLKALRSCFAVEREPVATRILAWDTHRPDCVATLVAKWGHPIATAGILDNYYQAVWRVHAREVVDLVRNNLLVLEAGALVHVDLPSLLRSPLGHQVGLFVWQAAAGTMTWALLGQTSLYNLNTPPPQLVTQCRSWIRDELGYETAGERRELDNTIDSYCRFLQRAQTHRLNQRTDEAFLHFMIALDLVLGLEGRSSDSVSVRAATLVHRQLGASLDEQITKLKSLYNRRSKYVHEGKSVDDVTLSFSECVCLEVLWCILAARGTSDIFDAADWLRRVDFVTAALRHPTMADPEQDLAAIGVPPLGHSRVPPNHVGSLVRPAPFVSSDSLFGRRDT